MKTHYKFTKASTSSDRRSTDSSITSVPKKAMFFSMFKRLMPMVVLLLLSTNGFSQFLYTDHYVGCIGYGSGDNIPPRGIDFTEYIEDQTPGNLGPCFRVCEKTEVNYWFIEPSGIESVNWSVEGGMIENDWSTPEHKVLVTWGEAGEGFLTLEIKYANGMVRERTICVEIIKGPTADFTLSTYQEEEGFLSCTNAEITFENLSVGAVQYLWDFGDYFFPDTNYSSQFEPTHVYKVAGTYTVTLTVINACNCEDVYTMDIHIEEAPPLLISCPGVVCEDDTVTYTVNDPCPGEWIVEGGTLIDGGSGNDYITIEWNDVSYTDGFGYIHYRSECGCPFWTTEKIPVVTVRSTIMGDETICVGGQNRYTLPQWPTTEYNWTLTPDVHPDHLIWVDQRNEVIIEGIEPGTYTLECHYKNTLLGCEGYASKTIRIFPKIEIIGENTFCASTMDKHLFTTIAGTPVDWELTYLDGTNIGNETGVITFETGFIYGGVYVLTASSATGCTSDPFYITVIDSSLEPLEPIVGVQEICQDNTYTYTCSNTTPGTVLQWSVTGNAVIQGSDTGSSVSIRYTGAGPYIIKVERVAVGGGVTCFYDADSTLNVKEASFDLEIGGYTSSPTFCSGSSSSFTATFGNVTPDHISWEILPAGFGNIVSGADTSTVTVIWNEVSGTATTGTVTVKATVCGNTQTDTLTVNLHKTPELAITSIIPSSGLCPDLATIDVTVNVTDINSGTLLFDFGNSTPIQSKTFSSSGNTTHTINNMFTNNSATDISQTLTVTLFEPNGCSFYPSTTQTFTIFPQTEITVFPEGNITFCSLIPFSYELTSNLSTGVTGSETFQWYRNGGTISGANSNTYTITNSSPTGIYKLKVIDVNGCEAYSQEIIVSEDCSTGPPACEVIPTPTIQVTAEWKSCNTIEAVLTYSGGPVTPSVLWESTSQLTLSQTIQNSPNMITAIFTTDIAGLHTVRAKLTYGDCTVATEYVYVAKNYHAGLEIEVVCNNNGEYDVTLHNNSSVFQEPSDLTYSYYRRIESSDTLLDSGIGLDQVSLTNVGEGDYTYVLQLHSPGNPDYPVCEVVHTLSLDPMPYPNNFTATPDKLTYCPNEPIALFIPDFELFNARGYTFMWNVLGHGSQIASTETTEISIAATGNYNVTLSIQTPMGCVLTSNPKMVNIPPSTYSGTLTPPVVNICEGAAFSGLTYSPTAGTTPPHKVVWMNGSEVAGVTALSTPFVPTESGLYWMMFEDANGCRFANGATTNHTSDVTIRKRPYVDIIGSETLCFGETLTLIGDVTDDTLERRWLRNGTPLAPYGAWNTSNPFLLEIEGTTAGTYTYTLEVRPATDIGCGSSVTHNLTVHPPVPVPEFEYEVLLCEPYTVALEVRHPLPGQYNWSNGDTGTYIKVFIGGAYRVTYTDLNGCTEIYELTVPHHSERYLWMMPKGCFDICPWSDPAPYIIGPWAEFDYHEWLVNGSVVQDDIDSPVTDITVDQPGTYQLAIEQDDCRYESELTYISPNQETLDLCGITECSIEYIVEEIGTITDSVYAVHGYIVNPFGVPITVTFSSFNGYGTYTPGSVTIPASGIYYFPPLVFESVPGFTGGEDYLVISVLDENCVTLVPIAFPQTEPYKLMPKDTELIDTHPAMLKVTPNPVGAVAAVSYDVGTEYQNAESLKIYTMLGTLVAEIDLKANSGHLPLNISNFPAGTYIITLQADGKTLLHQKLIKN